MRLDKFLCDKNVGTRNEVKQKIKAGQIKVNGVIQKDAGFNVQPLSDSIICEGFELKGELLSYFMLNKPQGLVSATEDRIQQTVIDLLKNENCKNLFPVGRLDKDTTGLLLITNDGKLAHDLLSPKKHVEKTYEVKVRDSITENLLEVLKAGVDIKDEKPTLPAKTKMCGEKEMLLTICEGRYHQVKRMLAALGNEVVALKRVSMGGIELDQTLLPGQYRRLSAEEVALLKREQERD